MEEKPTTVDPSNSKRVRFTDNGAKDCDSYSEVQDPEPLLLDPAGLPYVYVENRGDVGAASPETDPFDPGDDPDDEEEENADS